MRFGFFFSVALAAIATLNGSACGRIGFDLETRDADPDAGDAGPDSGDAGPDSGDASPDSGDPNSDGGDGGPTPMPDRFAPGSGGVSQTTQDSGSPSLASGPMASLMVAWQEEVVPSQRSIFLRSWDGTDWVELAGSASGDGVLPRAPAPTHDDTRAPELVIDSLGRPLIAYERSVSRGDVTVGVLRLEAGSWNAVSPGEFPTARGYSFVNPLGPAMALLADQPVLAYPATDPERVVVQIYDGSSWTDGSTLPGGSLLARPGPATMVDVATSTDGRIALAWIEDRQVYGLMFTGSSWVTMGPSALIDGNPNTNASPEVLFAQGGIGVAWDKSGCMARTVKFIYFNGVEWTTLEAGTLSGTREVSGCSNRMAREVSLAPDHYGNFAAAYHSEPVATPINNILFRRWDTDSWVGVGGSGSHPGLSDGQNNSFFPSLAAFGAQTCVAWEEILPDRAEIYLRCLSF